MPLSRRQRLRDYSKKLRDHESEVDRLDTEIGASSEPSKTAALIAERQQHLDQAEILRPVLEALQVEIDAKDLERDEVNARKWSEERSKATEEIAGQVGKCAEAFRCFLTEYGELVRIEETWKSQWASRGRPGSPIKSKAGRDVFDLLSVAAPPVRIRRTDSFWKAVGPVPTGRETAMQRIADRRDEDAVSQI